MTLHSRRWFCLAWAAAALICSLAGPARADVDGGAPADAGAGLGTGAPGAIDGAVFETLAPPPPPSPPPDLTLPTSSATLSTTMVEAAPPPPADVEPPRPITRRLWFWLAISGAVVAASIVVMAVQNPSVERPDCPAGYVCPR